MVVLVVTSLPFKSPMAFFIATDIKLDIYIAPKHKNRIHINFPTDNFSQTFGFVVGSFLVTNKMIGSPII